MTSKIKAPEYNEAAIRVLKGLEPVKQRPGMYTRTENPLHIVQEVIDNSADEAIGGYAHNITVELLPDSMIRISDDGRGIPVGMHPEEGAPVVELVFTRLHAGGKFDKAAGGAYKFSGGLHGVGVSVTNALSQLLRVDVRREGRSHSIEFSGGDVVKPLQRGERAEGTGTTVTVQPDPKYFDTPDIPVAALRELLRSKAVLLPGLRVKLIDARKDEAVEELFFYESGLATYLDELTNEDPLVPMLVGSVHAGDSDETFAEGEGATWAFSWFERATFEKAEGNGRSYVNLIPTPQHGTHVAGLRSAIFNAVRNYIDHHAMLPKGVKLTADDAFKSVRFVLSAKMLDPSFDGQTKDRLNSRDGVKLIEKMVQPSIEGWLNLNPVHAKTVADIVISNAVARQREAKPPEKRKSSSVVKLPGKLSDCESKDPAFAEIFLVEGDSAGGSAKLARSKETQAILPLRGKVLNSWEVDQIKALNNREIHDIGVAIGIPMHTMEDEVDFTKLRYGKICILSDADVDGFHIQCLLLTTFLRHFPQAVARGHIYIARPPLFRLDAESSGKKRAEKKIYAMDKAELNMWRDRLIAEGYSESSLRVSRFKGLGEMNPPQLWETALNPDTRRMSQVILPEDMRSEALDMFSNLMASGRAGWRKDWMERRGDEVEGS
ncbi:DNA topoisomerase IV subunit B [Roseateles asaccharophilus]|uniref:DNA topoisomerase IV subunit B n=1 Tax=Roseateles asaccharophilus TaxID=582607 RepID=UPI00384BB210